jgi:type IV pilus assembly protein PilY1
MNTNRLLQIGALTLIAAFAANTGAFTPSQQPPDTTAVPGNVVLALSVEFPTATQASYPSTTYTYTVRYEGYFDNRKCYTYDTTNEVFTPVSAQNASTGACPVATQWAGNLLNWLTMSNLDQFRSVMTGGTRDSFSSMATAHPGDTTTRTVLIRTFGSDQGSIGNNPVRTLTIGTPGLPLTGTVGTNMFARSFGYGSKFLISTTNNLQKNNANATLNFDMLLAQQKATCAATTLSNGRSCFNIRVEVCIAVPGVGLEANCQNKYSGVPKPEGLIQQYNNDMRFAALGYLNVANGTRNGAVLRSAMKSVGPDAATKIGVVPNPAPEWDPITGTMFTNPDSADALASNVENSGLMNYLNKFGNSGTYETYDNVSELFYASQLYLRGREPPKDYSDNLTLTPRDPRKDNFPVITGNDLLRSGARDPIINTCQKNYILGIGDINTHCDGNLPGSTNLRCSPTTVADPDASDGMNVQSLLNEIATYEGILPNAIVGVGNGSGLNGGNTPYIASLAYWSNTKDIRSDLSGTQNIKTYWVDVLEAWGGTIAAASIRKTQYWMATKYGGFKTDVATNGNPNSNPLSWDSDNNASPDNWFAGSNPVAMRNGLSQAFKSIASDSAASASSAAVSSSRQTSNSQIIYAGYSPKDWSGTVSACKPSQTEAQCAVSPDWEASKWFRTKAPLQVATPLTENTRKIFTSQRAATFTKWPFRWANLNTDQQAVLNAADSLGSARLDYLRGRRTAEGTTFRVRGDNLLGDIVNSGVTYVAGSGPAYSGSKFPGHTTYRNATKNRPPVVYVGSNDGMLHAFSGVDGKELFGYIPGSVFANLPALTDLAFKHRYFVDSTPMAGDFEKSAGVWGTMLVGGLGAGGRGFYALDISDQSNFATSSEGTLASTPMWEFTSDQDGDVGFTFNEPSINPITGAYLQVAKVADAAEVNGVWRVVVGNGYGSTGPAVTPPTPGRAVLFMLDANTGAVGKKLIADGGPTNGLSTPTPVDTDRDGLVDTIYAGDARGNMHKFQFTVPQGVDFVLAKAGDTLGQWRYIGTLYTASTAAIPSTREPITTAPSVVQACDGVGWNVTFGTGKLNEDSDYGDKTARGYYNVVDKSPSSTLTVPSADLGLISVTESALGVDLVRRDWVTPNLNGKRGWRLAFADGERVLSNSTLPPDTGTVLFATTKPKGDICTPGNTGFLVAINLCSGRSGDLLVNGALVGGISIKSSGVVKVSNTYTDTTNKQTVVCNQDGCKGPAPPALNPAVAPRGRYNWREILTK